MSQLQSQASPPAEPLAQQPEALRYARLLGWGTRLGIVFLFCSFAAYVSGLLPPQVPLDLLPTLWKQPVAMYLQSTGAPTGWHWLSLAHKGDFINMIGIAVLAGCSIPPLLAVIPQFLKRRDFAYAVICALISGVLVLAASGLLTGGH